MWCCCALALLAFQGGEEPKPRPELLPAVKPVVALARAGPAEFFAATILKLVEGGKIDNAELRTQLLDEAFSTAAKAHEPVRLVGIAGTPPDTRAYYRSRAGELKLDAISLQSAVVKLLLTFDASHARQLFERLQTPQIEARPCTDPLVADASTYYESAAAIAQAAFNATEKEKEAHFQFLQRILGGVSSPSALAEFLSALEGVGLSPTQRQLIMGAVAARMEALSADYRPFAISVESVQKNLEQLEARVRAEGRDTAVLARAFRAYLVNQLSSPRCDEDLGPAAQAVTWFNTKFRGSLAAIEVKEMQPASRKGALVAAAYFESTDAKRISVALNALRYGPNGPRG